jgi:heme exporter protein C
MTARPALAQTAKLLLGIWMAGVVIATFLVVPEIQGLGDVGRIFIIHVPTAWLAVLAFAVSALFSALYLWRGQAADDANAQAAAEAGLLYTILATVTGAIFAQAVWGIFWNWDPRQTSIFVLMLIYGAYFALRSALDDETRRRRLSAVYALLAFVTVPFLVFVIPRAAESTLHPNCALLPGSKCEGIELGGQRTVGLLGDMKLELIGVEREGDLVTAQVRLTEPGLASQELLEPSFDLAAGIAPDTEAAQPRLAGNDRFRLQIASVDGERLTLTIRSPGDTSLLENLRTRTTFFASLIGFTLLYIWVHRVRAALLTVQDRLQPEGVS